MKTAVFGATGRTDLPLVERALDRDHEVVAHTRSLELLPGRDRHSVVEGDAYTGSGVAGAVSGVDAVVSLLGQGSDSPDDLLTVAGDRILSAMEEAGVDGLVGAGVRETSETTTIPGRAMGALLRVVARDLLEDATEHVQRVKASDLRWTVVRAPRLTAGDPQGAYRVENDDYVRAPQKVGPA